MNHHQIYFPSSYRTMPWRNGLGQTIELLRENLPGSSNFAWRLSIADVVSDGLFSDFSGYDRTLLLLQGQGLTLNHYNGKQDQLVEYLQAAHFQGDNKSYAKLLDGPIKDFNVISRRDFCTTRVTSLKNVEQKHFVISSDVFLIYAPEEAITIQSDKGSEYTVEANHLFHVNQAVDKQLSVSGTSLIVIQIYYK